MAFYPDTRLTGSAVGCSLRWDFAASVGSAIRRSMDDPPTSMQWMARATEARSLAETMRDSDARSTMLAIAAGYEKLARRAEAATVKVPATSTDVYRSSNGDLWRLITDSVSGRRVVRHEPNSASGGQITETPVEEFLAVNGPGPEYRGIAATARQQRGCLTTLTGLTVRDGPV